MITKGKVLEIYSNEVAYSKKNRFLRVHIPLFETAGETVKKEFDCKVLYQPGLEYNYHVGDIVYVDFENNEMNDPIVIGKLQMISTKQQDQSDTMRGAAKLNSLEVSSSVSLPANVMMNGQDISNLPEFIKNTKDTVEAFAKEIGDFKHNDLTVIDLR